jgi:hypothetical protein
MSEWIGTCPGPDMNIYWDKIKAYFKTMDDRLFASISNGEQEKNW